MTITVDVLVVGANPDALASAIASARNGNRVLVISNTRNADLRRRIRRARRLAGTEASKRIGVLTGAEVECVAGVRSVEAVLARYIATGRRIDVNTSSLLAFEEKADVARSGC